MLGSWFVNVFNHQKEGRREGDIVTAFRINLSSKLGIRICVIYTPSVPALVPVPPLLLAPTLPQHLPYAPGRLD